MNLSTARGQAKFLALFSQEERQPAEIIPPFHEIYSEAKEAIVRWIVQNTAMAAMAREAGMTTILR
ncbi:MAG: hypothetical protein JWQ02_3689 [Capsulimonas sp.]|jgi:hypothetical protein|nr:hypothetical protein [Capsulimonas sp.]